MWETKISKEDLTQRHITQVGETTLLFHGITFVVVINLITKNTYHQVSNNHKPNIKSDTEKLVGIMKDFN